MTTQQTVEPPIVGDLYAALDIIAAAEIEFARTDDHHAYYGRVHDAVQRSGVLIKEAVEALTSVRERLLGTPTIGDVIAALDIIDAALSRLTGEKQ